MHVIKVQAGKPIVFVLPYECVVLTQTTHAYGELLPANTASLSFTSMTASTTCLSPRLSDSTSLRFVL